MRAVFTAVSKFLLLMLGMGGASENVHWNSKFWFPNCQYTKSIYNEIERKTKKLLRRIYQDNDQNKDQFKAIDVENNSILTL